MQHADEIFLLAVRSPALPSSFKLKEAILRATIKEENTTYININCTTVIRVAQICVGYSSQMFVYNKM
jgi:hypothetical protein